MSWGRYALAEAVDCEIAVESHEAEVLLGLQASIYDGTVVADMVDGFADKVIPERLEQDDFTLYDGRSLRRFTLGGDFHLLAIRERGIDCR
jgi:hypothetical protein